MMRFDDKDLIAHYLRELPPGKAQALEHAIQIDPILAFRYAAYADILRAYKADATTMVVDDAAMARNWKNFQSSLGASRVHTIGLSRWAYPALAGAGVAIAFTVLFVATRPSKVTLMDRTPLSRDQGSIALPTPQSETSSAVDGQLIEQLRLTLKRGRATKHALTSTQRVLPGELSQPLHPHITPPLPLSTIDASVTRFIPLASMPMPEQPLPLPAFVTDGSEAQTGSMQIAVPKTRFKFQHAHTGVHNSYPTDLTFAMGGTLIGTREIGGSGTTVHTLGATHAVTALAAFHQQLRPAVGYRLAVSYARPDFLYSLRDATTNSGQSDINGRIYEIAATYVVQGPRRGIISTSAEAGGGLMAILPSVPDPNTRYNLRGTALAGISADFALTKHLGIHAMYRAQAFKGPDFHYSGAGNSIVSTTFLSSEPMVGITYRFHSK